MKKKSARTPKTEKETPNAERRTPNVERRKRESAQPYVREAEPTYGAGDSSAPGDKKRYDLEERLLEFASRIVRLVDALPHTRAGNHIGSQLLRCGTSPLANHGEVEAAESRNDFIHKLRICLKELRETSRWLRLVERVELVRAGRIRPLFQEGDELVRIFNTSIRTAGKNRG
jgi:four helix bundle protein